MDNGAVVAHTATLSVDIVHAPVGDIFQAHSAAVEEDQTRVREEHWNQNPSVMTGRRLRHHPVHHDVQ